MEFAYSWVVSSRRWQNIAKYFFDMSKVILAGAVVAQLVEIHQVDLKVIEWGIGSGVLFLLVAIVLDVRGD
jgi:hypothetical protein